MIFTTSWDDGHPFDQKIIQLLLHYGMKGTFYIAKQHEHLEKPHDTHWIKEVGDTMEIGAHTLTHCNLTEHSIDQQREEIVGSKVWLEDTIKKPCNIFCYPRGKYDAATKEIVKNAGFIGARSTKNFSFHSTSLYDFPSTLHLYPFPLRPIMDWRAIKPLWAWSSELQRIGIPLASWRNWGSMARACFQYAIETNQPWFHLRGHSWEIDTYQQWNDLQEFLNFINEHRSHLSYMTNGELIDAIIQKKA